MEVKAYVNGVLAEGTDGDGHVKALSFAQMKITLIIAFFYQCASCAI